MDRAGHRRIRVVERRAARLDVVEDPLRERVVSAVHDLEGRLEERLDLARLGALHVGRRGEQAIHQGKHLGPATGRAGSVERVLDG